MTRADDPVASPCTDDCRLDPTTGLGRGCRRTVTEIAAWASLTAIERRAVLARLPGRRPLPDQGDA
jgi:hypothetical protein